MDEKWPLIGRNEELSVVAAALANPDSSGVVLVGPAGVGKTRLATGCMSLGIARGFATARVVASRAASAIPFGALAPLLPPGAVAIERGLNALRQATIALTDLADGRPLMLLVDDAHALDDASAVLLQQLAATRAAFLVVTLRSGETPLDSIVSLWKDHGVERLTIEPLSRPNADQFVSTMLGGEVETGTLNTLWSKTQGNPMFLRELVLGATEHQSLEQRTGRWYTVGELEPSDRLSELVSSRLSGLARTELEALELVAFGEPIGVGMVTDLSDAHVIEELERKGLIAMVRDGRRNEIRLAHPMYGEVLRARTPALRIRSVCRSLAEAVEATGANRREDALRVSLWRLDGGGVAPMPLLLAGTAQAYFANDLLTAERLARTAFDIEPSFTSGLLLTEILYELGRGRECVVVLTTVARIAETEFERARVAVVHATTLFWKLGDIDQARQVMHDALETLTSPSERDEVTAFQALVDVQAGQPHLALHITMPVLTTGSGRPYVLAALAGALAISIVGRPLDAIEMADKAVEMRQELGQELTLFQTGLLLVAKMGALQEAGRIDEAYELAEFTRSLAAETNDLSNQGFCCISLARITLAAGRLHESAARAAEAVDLFRRCVHPGPMRWGLGYLALASAMSGDLRTARDALSELAVLAPHPALMLEIDCDRARAWTAVSEGRLGDARIILRTGAEAMRASGQISFEASVLFDIARLGTPKDVTVRLGEIADIGQSELHHAMAATASALARCDAAALAEAANSFERFGTYLFAAETAVAAADAYRKAGDRRRSAEWSRRSVEFAARCDGARTPGLTHVASHVPLTQREREIATLAGQGLSSKSIGERLFVASRTVDNHLARIYDKLGVANRADLADAMSSL